MGYVEINYRCNVQPTIKANKVGVEQRNHPPVVSALSYGNINIIFL